jgi:hypothetical protein
MRPALLAALLSLHLAAQTAAPEPSFLHQVRRIHIGALGDNRDWTKLLRQNLRTELQTAGFQIVDQPSAADAILSADPEFTITVDGDQWDREHDPDDYYLFKLTLPTTGALLWKAKVITRLERPEEKESRDVARLLSRKLAAACRKSAGKAGPNAPGP